MNKVQLELEQAITLYQAASVGKLISGLIHNINGPLHTIGMEMDVLGVLLSKKPDKSPHVLEDFSNRLARMGKEFEKLNSLIRQAADRAEVLSESPPAYINLNHILREELEFLQANLYFKHRVETVTEFQENIQSLTPRTNYLALGLRWFLQAIVEDLEQNKIERLHLKTQGVDQHALLTIGTEGASLSPSVLTTTQYDPGPEPVGLKDLNDVGMLLAVTILKSSGITMVHDSRSDYSQFRLYIPYK